MCLRIEKLIDMEIRVQPITSDRYSVLSNLVQLYLYDISELDQRELGKDGCYSFRDINFYLQANNGWAFQLLRRGIIVGFALVALRRSWIHEDTVYSIDDLFVLRNYRKQGIGRIAAFRLFSTFPGTWEVSEMEENKPAHVFWRQVVDEFTKGRFLDTTVLVDGRWNRPTQRFVVSEDNCQRSTRS